MKYVVVTDKDGKVLYKRPILNKIMEKPFVNCAKMMYKDCKVEIVDEKTGNN